jgi:hypothetical protein
LLYSVSRLVVGVVVLLQFFWVLFTRETNKPLETLGLSLATYTYQIICYLTFNTEERPFPFDLDWPAGPPGTECPGKRLFIGRKWCQSTIFTNIETIVL